MALNADLRAEGPLHAYLKKSFGLDDRQFAQLVRNTGLAADILSAACRDGTLVFDLDPAALLKDGTTTPLTLDCATGAE